jgi:hypothetical protein
MLDSIFDMLRANAVTVEDGLSDEEISRVESMYRVSMPCILKKLLKKGIPISKGFYNWRDFSKANVSYIRRVIRRPYDDIYDMAEEIEWPALWGEKPQTKKKATQAVRRKLQHAPLLIPIYAHRYIPVSSIPLAPIISIHGVDIIYYGKDLIDYLYIEFGNKKQECIDFKEINYIPFWSDLIGAV